EEAVQRGRLPRNPVVLTQPPPPDRTRRKLGWTLDEARAFLLAVADNRLYAAFHLGLVTGMRRGEILALRWVDVDLDARQLDVVQQLTLEGSRPIIKQLKTHSSDRLVTFGATTAAVLMAHRRRQQDEAAILGPGWPDSGLVFTTALGAWIDPNNFSRIMASLIAKAGVPRITPKGLRHTAQSVGRVVVGGTRSCRNASATPTSASPSTPTPTRSANSTARRATAFAPPDDLDEFIADRADANPDFPRLVDEAMARRNDEDSVRLASPADSP
ncbi:MAG TPA: site-specific integrase, partial [Acidimicrobiales bacterium]|nr:site-specific integrase [Acidimicrobiales bacterium]